MIGPGDQDVKRHTEIVDLSGDLTSCPDDIASYPIALNYAGLGTFVGGRGAIHYRAEKKVFAKHI